jgi:SSS family solute:Na+ symporter
MPGMPTYFTALDWFVLIVYFLGMMLVGLAFYKRSRNTEGFTTAGRSLPGWVCGLSILATYVSSISFLALPGKAYAANWNPFVFSLSLPIAAWLAVRFFMPYYRSTGDTSAYAHLERRFGPWARGYASLFFILTQLARIGVVMYLMAMPLCVLLQKDIQWIILVTGLSVTIYSFAGGIMAVIWTDCLQAIVFMVGAALCSLLIFFNMPEGPRQVFQIAAEHHKFSLGSLGPALGESTFWVVLAYGIVINLQNFGIDQGYVQRYIASKSDREARKSIWIGALLYLPLSAIFFFIGTQLFAFYSVRPDYRQEARAMVATQKLMYEGVDLQAADFGRLQAEKAASLTDPEIGDGVFPHFIGRVLPPGITGLLIAAIFAAGMSTVSTSLNSSATLLVADWYVRFFRPQADERRKMIALYGATVVWGILGTGVALLLTRTSGSILDTWWTLAGILGGGMIGLFLLGMISRKAHNPVAAASVILGASVMAWMTLTKGGSGKFHSLLTPVFGTLTILLAGIVLSALMNHRQDNA